MQRVKVSADFGIQIPEEVRRELDIEPGQEFLVSVFHGSMLLEPLSLNRTSRDITELRGIAKGIRWKRSDRDRSPLS